MYTNSDYFNKEMDPVYYIPGMVWETPVESTTDIPSETDAESAVDESAVSESTVTEVTSAVPGIDMDMINSVLR